MKLNPKQTELLNFINGGGIITQLNNRLWMNGEVLNTKTLTSLMYQLHGADYIKELNKLIVNLDK
jgi:hypothetical protein